VDGELTLVGATRPISFDLVVSDGGELSATAVVKQSAWGVKPYSALFGALKVKDEVRVELRGQLGSQSR
jgi:polyisoprenoid-binding protein YceI